MAAHQHGHEHDHGDEGHSGRAHAPKTFGRAFAIGLVLNLGFVLVEAGYGFAANSTSLLADAGHNLSDVLGLAVAWVAATLAARRPSARYTYGLRSSSILAALFNAVFLFVAVGAIAWEALRRFGHPEPVAGGTIMAVAAAGVVVNGVTAWLFASGRKSDVNVRGAFLHMAADAAVSAGVVAAGAGIVFTGWLWLDPLTSLLVVAVIVWSGWGLLRETLAMSLAAVPGHIDPQDVRAHLLEAPGVAALHDLHIWPMSTTEVALTAHLVMPGGHPGDAALHALCAELRARFGIGHATLQVETDPQAACTLEPDHVV